ncbi:MAG: hypothetical protein A3J29_19020 [Acidobacteria bacterium RIFCSPLOWO2_12_FULL_67_14b]|nr:MAG: hypothetical protein A3J29_19020 [Acidobacteria bacterium RIFCSPLOWO2_12_FULL_67_14b]
MVVHDWRASDAGLIAPLYAAEAVRWQCDLRWDTSAVWRQVEAARAAGVLPGFVARTADGRVCGWSFHVRHRDTFQVGGLVASSPAVTESLLEAMWTSPEATSAEGGLLFGHFAAPGLTDLLAGKGVAVARYRYLIRALPADGGAEGAPDWRPRTWRTGDVAHVSALLSSAYGPDPSRPFAPGGRADEWEEYLGQLMGTCGCGEFDSGLSVVAPARSEGLDGAALVTRLAPETAHLAQIAVRPNMQGRAMGASLLGEAMARATAAGCRSLTLLVGATNTRACRLYERCGFVETVAFLSGSFRKH